MDDGVADRAPESLTIEQEVAPAASMFDAQERLSSHFCLYRSARADAFHGQYGARGFSQESYYSLSYIKGFHSECGVRGAHHTYYGVGVAIPQQHAQYAGRADCARSPVGAAR